MIGGMLEFASDGLSLSVLRGFLRIKKEGDEIGRVPLDDIQAVILTARDLTVSRRLMSALIERKAIVVFCGQNYHPESILHSLSGHYASAGVLADQIDASQPLKKRLWQQLVIAKIRAQARCLLVRDGCDDTIVKILALAKGVKSGDPDNREAQAARLYWPALMGQDFRRDQSALGVNSALNYGYAILRAGTARAACAAGLHPSLGVQHSSRVNAFALVDDLMEPFRPLVDRIVWRLCQEGADLLDLTPDIKRRLAAVLEEPMHGPSGETNLSGALQYLAQSLAKTLGGEAKKLDIFEEPAADRLV